MQTYDKDNNMLTGKMVEQYDDIKKEMEKPETAFVTIGHIPSVGHEFETNGLKFKVIMSNNKKGRFTAELLRG